MMSMVLREGFFMVLTGVVIGVVGALASRRPIATLLFGITARDVPAFVGATIAIGLAALLATLLPARCAARVDPMVALRCE
jgi:putative ABC transport system permease protein